MSKYKVCVYAISKNEEAFVDRWVDAVNEADLIVVLDTGSTDNTVEKLKNRGVIVHEEEIIPWRFDVARNKALDFVPDDVDICVSNDLDEVFERGWRDKLENAWEKENTRAKYWFAWEHDVRGNIVKKFSMEKIHLRHGFKWKHPVHEVLEYFGENRDNSVFIDTIILHHYPNNEKSRAQYLPLLELSIKENPSDDRGMFWLGREYCYEEQYDKCISTLKKYLNMPTAIWDEERSGAMRFISKAYLAKGVKNEAKSWLFRAAAQCFYVREPWLEIAKFGYVEGDWELVFFATGKGLEIKTNRNSYLVSNEAWSYVLNDLGAIACFHLGMYDKAVKHAKIACEIEPENERLKNNKDIILEKIKEESAYAQL